MRLLKCIRYDSLTVLEADTKDAALNELLTLIEDTAALVEIDELRRLVFRREESMSTGLELGIAVPHARIDGLVNPLIAIGTKKDGISDYESMDGSVISIVCMIVTGTGNPSIYSMLLAELIEILKRPEARDELLDAGNPAQMYAAISSYARDGAASSG